jgi:hypothetical protein
MNRLNVLLAGALVLVAAASLSTIRAVAQTSSVTDDNLSESIANAKTPADHEAIATYYDEEAADADKKAALHRRSVSIAKPVGMANMCSGLAKYWEKVSAQDKELAKAHREMAKAAGSETGH